MIRTDDYIRQIFLKPLGAQVEARGWVKTRRDSKGIHFIQLNDGSSFQDLQVVIESGLEEGARVLRNASQYEKTT